MGISEKLAGLFGRASSGEVPHSRDTAEDCLVLSFFALLEVWMSDGAQGGEKLAQEVDGLITCLKNKQDPLVRSFGTMDRMALFAGLNTLTKQKEQLKNGQSTEE